jgi:hypothetical protein
MAITYGLQVWDTRAFPLGKISRNVDLPKVDQQRRLLSQQHVAPSTNALVCAEELQQLAETLASVHPWMKTYLQDLSAQFRQQSTAVLTINVPKKPSRFTILAYFVTMVASQNRMVTYNAAGGFYILPLPDVVSKSICPKLYKNLLHTVPSNDFEPFMRIYRNALIAEQLVDPIDLIDWDEYPMSNDNREFEAQCMFEKKVAIYLKDKEVTFDFDKKTKKFKISVKQISDFVFCLQFELSTAIQEQGIGRVMINSYISVNHKNFLEKSELLIDVNEEFRRNFQIEIDDTSILKHWSIFDLRTDFNPIDFRWRICEYQKWSDFFYQIQSLIRFSKYIVDDIHNINDFLDVFEHCLNSDLSLRDIIGYNRRNEVATCYLMYAKLLRPSLFVILAKETRKLGGNMGKMVDYIQNYELAT